ncbi:Inorganic phosphate transporter pho84 [Mortierella sp. 14UC]|nr:Inorganic phosphate transporter pho84 [Mortierella sp. 14UC]
MVTLRVLIRFRALIIDDDEGDNMDMVWRICIAVGCLPALSTALIRYTMPAIGPVPTARLCEDPQSRFDDDDDVDVLSLNDMSVKEQGLNDATDTIRSSPVQSSTTTPALSPLSLSKTPQRQRRGHTRVFREYCSRWENFKVLIGTFLSWFLLDIAFRSIFLNQSYLLDALGMTESNANNNPQDLEASITSKTTLYRQLRMSTLGNLTVSLLGIVPGYWFAIFSIEKMGHK